MAAMEFSRPIPTPRNGHHPNGDDIVNNLSKHTSIVSIEENDMYPDYTNHFPSLSQAEEALELVQTKIQEKLSNMDHYSNARMHTERGRSFHGNTRVKSPEVDPKGDDDDVYCEHVQMGDRNIMLVCEPKTSDRKQQFRQIGDRNVIINLQISTNACQMLDKDGAIVQIDSDGEVWLEIRRRSKSHIRPTGEASPAPSAPSATGSRRCPMEHWDSTDSSTRFSRAGDRLSMKFPTLSASSRTSSSRLSGLSNDELQDVLLAEERVSRFLNDGGNDFDMSICEWEYENEYCYADVFNRNIEMEEEDSNYTKVASESANHIQPSSESPPSPSSPLYCRLAEDGLDNTEGSCEEDHYVTAFTSMTDNPTYGSGPVNHKQGNLRLNVLDPGQNIRSRSPDPARRAPVPIPRSPLIQQPRQPSPLGSAWQPHGQGDAMGVANGRPNHSPVENSDSDEDNANVTGKTSPVRFDSHPYRPTALQSEDAPPVPARLYSPDVLYTQINKHGNASQSTTTAQQHQAGPGTRATENVYGTPPAQSTSGNRPVPRPKKGRLPTPPTQRRPPFRATEDSSPVHGRNVQEHFGTSPSMTSAASRSHDFTAEQSSRYPVHTGRERSNVSPTGRYHGDEMRFPSQPIGSPTVMSPVSHVASCSPSQTSVSPKIPPRNQNNITPSQPDRQTGSRVGAGMTPRPVPKQKTESPSLPPRHSPVPPRAGTPTERLASLATGPVEGMCWFHSNIDRHVSSVRLQRNNKEGAFLVRHSSAGSAHAYSLDVFFKGAVRCLKIVKAEDQYFLDGGTRTKYPAVCDLINALQIHGLDIEETPGSWQKLEITPLDRTPYYTNFKESKA